MNINLNILKEGKLKIYDINILGLRWANTTKASVGSHTGKIMVSVRFVSFLNQWQSFSSFLFFFYFFIFSDLPPFFLHLPVTQGLRPLPPPKNQTYTLVHRSCGRKCHGGDEEILLKREGEHNTKFWYLKVFIPHYDNLICNIELVLRHKFFQYKQDLVYLSHNWSSNGTTPIKNFCRISDPLLLSSNSTTKIGQGTVSDESSQFKILSDDKGFHTHYFLSIFPLLFCLVLSSSIVRRQGVLQFFQWSFGVGWFWCVICFLLWCFDFIVTAIAVPDRGRERNKAKEEGGGGGSAVVARRYRGMNLEI